MQTTSDRIRIVMKDSGVNQAMLASRLGTSQASVSLWLSGKANPSSQTIKQICDAFGVNPEWLTEGNGDPYGLSPASKEIVDYLSHAITHNCTMKDSFIRAVAASDDATIAAVVRFMHRVIEEIKQQDPPPAT